MQMEVMEWVLDSIFYQNMIIIDIIMLIVKLMLEGGCFQYTILLILMLLLKNIITTML
jgi:hypothetical protein